ncbi:MAG: ATP-binding cassette domain-containing protein [Xanthobacteraceae bacterium]|nr:ATP-binding cassette domain-containing protein [Xanthobacteraceae bacterium]
MTQALFEIDRLSGGYGSGLVVRDVSLAVGRGEAVCLLGRNGVGKSTLVKLACGVLRPAGGTVTIAGREITGRPPSDNLGAGLTYCPQERVVFDDLTVAENLTLMRDNRRLDAFDRFFEVFPRLSERRRQHAGTLSGGEKKLLSFVRGLAEGANMVVIDEPTEGVQFENVVRMADLIQSHKQAGMSFLVVEQNLTLVERVADRIVIMDHGDVVHSGAAADMARDEILSYLTV